MRSACAGLVKAACESCRIRSTRVADRSRAALFWCARLQPPTQYGEFMRHASFGPPATSLPLIGLCAAPACAEPPAPPATATARAEPAALTVATPHSMDGYARDEFGIWLPQPDGCTTRRDVLARDGNTSATSRTAAGRKPAPCTPRTTTSRSPWSPRRPSTTWPLSPRPGARASTSGAKAHPASRGDVRAVPCPA